METKNIYTQLLLAQGEIPSINCDSKNPFYKDKPYASLPNVLSIVLPVLRKYDILFTSEIVETNIILKLIYTKASELNIVTTTLPLLNTQDMQKMGGCITYATRYGLLSLLGIAPDLDDDGNGVIQKETIKPQTKSPTPKPDNSAIINTIKHANTAQQCTELTQHALIKGNADLSKILKIHARSLGYEYDHIGKQFIPIQYKELANMEADFVLGQDDAEHVTGN